MNKILFVAIIVVLIGAGIAYNMSTGNKGSATPEFA